MEKSDVFPVKLKVSPNILYQEINNKLIHVNDLNKQILF